jgi:hypothetical protein
LEHCDASKVTGLGIQQIAEGNYARLRFHRDIGGRENEI